MNAFEWVGFFISMLSVLFLVGKSVYDALQKNKNPTKYQAQQEEAERRLKAFLRGETASPTMDRILREVIDDDEEDEEEELEQVRSRVSFRQPLPSLPSPPLEPAIVASELEGQRSYVKGLLAKEQTKKNMVILSEIFGTPKGLRPL